MCEPRIPFPCDHDEDGQTPEWEKDETEKSDDDSQ